MFVRKIIKYVISLVVMVCFGFSIFSYIGTIPDSKVVSGVELSERAKKEMIDAGIVDKDETIKYFYSESLFSFVDFGNLFTENSVVSYELDQDSNERNLYSAKYSDIKDIIFDKSTNPLDDSVIRIYLDEDNYFSLVVSTEDHGDKIFYDALVKEWKK